MAKELNKPDYLFEVSWEVCNKVGGIYTVIATKSLFLKSQLNRHHILIGPDVWMDTDANPDFHEDPLLWQDWRLEAAKSGLRLRIGKWNVPGNPVAILVDFKQFLTEQNWILGKYWEVFGVDSITGNWDYKESALFGYVSGKVIESFYNFYLSSSDKVVAQFHEWQTGAGVLYLKYRKLPVATSSRHTLPWSEGASLETTCRFTIRWSRTTRMTRRVSSMSLHSTLSKESQQRMPTYSPR